ncbi:MAG: hypothetical protein C3F11_08710 [Methylocystaceae bacterium]|nr:MAG: hypothetical protein C3F11_08710 [Methylocystaceae bacterium]
MNDTAGRSKDGSVVAGAAANLTTKQPYLRPKLAEYGDLKEITSQIGLVGNEDGLLGGLNTILRTSVISVILG